MQHRPSNRPVFDRMLIAAAVLLAALLAAPILTIPLHIPINYNEGWNAGFDTRAVTSGTGPLYPGPDSFVFNNYPPLGFFIVGAAGRFVFGDMILAGRILALMALLSAAGLLGSCVRGLGGNTRAALASALLLLLFACSYYRGYVAMDDPQWLAHALMLAGLALLLHGPAMSPGQGLPATRVAGAALLMVAGGFVKHNLVALPLATTLWLLWLSPRTALVWLAAAAAGLALGIGLTDALFGHAAFDDILHHRRVFRVHLLTHSISRLAPLLPLAIILATSLRRRIAGNGTVLVALFAAIALVTGILQRMGEGVYYNAHFETLIALCLGFGVVLTPAFANTIRWRERRIGPAALAIFAALPVLGALPFHLPILWHDAADRIAREAAWQPAIARLAAADGPVGCEMLSLCYWAGKPFAVDTFNLTQSVLAGGPLDAFREAVANGTFALFEDDPASFLHEDARRKLGYDPVMGAFSGRYTVVATAPGGAVLLGRTPRPGEPANP